MVTQKQLLDIWRSQDDPTFCVFRLNIWVVLPKPLFLPLSLKERINIQQQMFSKGHYIYKYEQNPPAKDEI